MAGLTMHESSRQIERLFTQGTVVGLSDSALLRRFATVRDEEAFGGLVARHGPMVLGVCRGVLADPNDAEDAFQATFLTLARQAKSIWVEDSLGGWLHRVARRTALKANARAIRRRKRERREFDLDRIASRGEPGRDEAARTLHEEIDRLPESHRRALVVCALEGLTHAEAAQVLGCGEATVRRRLVAAKERLRARLDRRGFALPASLAAPSTLPLAWVEATVKVAIADAAALVVASGVAQLASSLTAGALVRRVIAGMLIGGGLAAGLVAIRPGPDPVPPPNPGPEVGPPPVVAQVPPPIATPTPKSEDEFTFQGRVFDPDGKPFHQGAEVFAKPDYRPDAVATATASDAEGRFRMTFDVQAHRRATYLNDERVDGKSMPASNTWIVHWPKLVAVAPGFGFGVSALGREGEEVVRLVADEPVEGRVLDLEGRPVAGATVRVRGLLAPRQGDLTAWLDAARKAVDQGEYRQAEYQFLSILGRYRDGLSAIYPKLLPPVTTGADGRFRIVGIGRERVAWVAIEKPGIESRLVAVATRPGVSSFVVPAQVARLRNLISNSWGDLPVHGSRFDHVAGPAGAVEGTVLDQHSRAPIPGVVVVPDFQCFVEWSDENRYRAVTDARGRYRVEGLPEGGSFQFSIQVPKDQPYLGIERAVAVGRGLALPTVADFALKRGVWVEGRVLDGATGNPLWNARVLYRVFPDNPHLPRGSDRVAFDNNGVSTDNDGRYRVAAYPGRGLLTVFAGTNGYASGVGADRISGRKEVYGRMVFPTVPEAVSPENMNLVAEINPAEGAGPVTLDLLLEKARVREGRAIGPEGPVAGGLLASGLSSWMGGPQQVEGGRIEVKNLSKGEERRVVVRFDEKKLIGLAVLKADEAGVFEVKLEPWATLDGRLVDAEGRSRQRGLIVKLRDDQKLPVYLKGCGDYSTKPSPFLLDENGRFHAEALLPGQPYDVEIVEGRIMAIDHAAKGLVLKPGEGKDLGDVVVKKP